jgi:ABC-type nitrate/sulfonate/bicarbonate transport system substrate-binding protein
MLQGVTRKTLVIGFIPLLDCASLVVAVEKGFIAEEGLHAALVRETSWANIRDRLVVGHFDAAHMLGPMTLASTLGIGHLKVPLVAPYSMGSGSNAITVTNDLWAQMKQHGAALGADPLQQGKALAAVVRERAKQDLPPLTFGMVYPFSCHNYELRYWLAVAGIDPDRDVRLVVIPPPLSVDALRAGQVDGYCVGEPWNSLAVAAGVGCIVTPNSAIWQVNPEKVLGFRQEWAEKNPERLDSLLRAMYKASSWCDDPENRRELASILSEPKYVGVAPDVLRLGLSRRFVWEPGSIPLEAPESMLFAAHDVTFPWVSHAAWFYSQMVRWGQLKPSAANQAAALATYRPDLYRRALKTLDLKMPEHDVKLETRSAKTLGGFFDGRAFDSRKLEEYIAASLPVPSGDIQKDAVGMS